MQQQALVAMDTGKWVTYHGRRCTIRVLQASRCEAGSKVKCIGIAKQDDWFTD